jgi:hypothetical protein
LKVHHSHSIEQGKTWHDVSGIKFPTHLTSEAKNTAG